MDPNHRDRVAFLRLCSGRFRRGMKLKQSGTGKQHRRPQSDPVLRAGARDGGRGVARRHHRHSQSRRAARGRHACPKAASVVFTGIPNFAPEILRRVRLADPMKQKHLTRALESLAEEGVTQVFKPMIGAQWIVGVVGQLQLDVLKSRLRGRIRPRRRAGSLAIRHGALAHGRRCGDGEVRRRQSRPDGDGPRRRAGVPRQNQPGSWATSRTSSKPSASPRPANVTKSTLRANLGSERRSEVVVLPP